MSDRYWVIKYDDADIPDAIFTDEEIATKTYRRSLQSWNCTLFMEVDLHRERITELEKEHNRLVAKVRQLKERK